MHNSAHFLTCLLLELIQEGGRLIAHRCSCGAQVNGDVTAPRWSVTPVWRPVLFFICLHLSFWTRLCDNKMCTFDQPWCFYYTLNETETQRKDKVSRNQNNSRLLSCGVISNKRRELIDLQQEKLDSHHLIMILSFHNLTVFQSTSVGHKIFKNIGCSCISVKQQYTKYKWLH